MIGYDEVLTRLHVVGAIGPCPVSSPRDGVPVHVDESGVLLPDASASRRVVSFAGGGCSVKKYSLVPHWFWQRVYTPEVKQSNAPVSVCAEARDASATTVAAAMEKRIFVSQDTADMRYVAS